MAARPGGERIYQAVAGKRRERTSIIAASQQNKLVAPLVFQGNCNTEVVDVYFEQVLLPVLPRVHLDTVLNIVCVTVPHR